MRVIVFSLLCLIESVAFSEFNKNVFWDGNNSEKLWQELNEEPVEILYDNQSIFRKQKSSIVCDKIITTRRKDLEISSRTNYMCIFPRKFEKYESDLLYQSLVKMREVKISEALIMKIVGQLFVIKKLPTNTYGWVKIFFDHPCTSVQNLSEADKCMEFWNQHIFTSSIFSNKHLTVSNSSKVKSMLSVLSKWSQNQMTQPN